MRMLNKSSPDRFGVNFLSDGSDGTDGGIIVLQFFFDLLHAVHDGGVIAAAHDLADFLQGGAVILAEIHGYLAGVGDIGGTLVAVDIGRT